MTVWASCAGTFDRIVSRYDFCCNSDGRLGRRRVLDETGIVLCGEVLASPLGRWRLADEVMATAEWPAITEDEALKLAGDGTALLAPFPDEADSAQHGGRNHADRLDWLDAAIVATLNAARSEEDRVANEMPWARPGSWDYDYEIDAISWIKLAYRTLQSLFEEKQDLLTREVTRRSRTDDE
jgi:hypothetical protein